MNREIKTAPIMAALFIAGFVGLFSETALNIALGELSNIFSVSPTTIQWLATGYFLTLGILVPVSGIAMQKFTTRQLFITSVLLSIFGTIVAAIAPVYWILLAGRIIQAAGLAIILPLTQNVIFTIYPPLKRGGAMGAMGLVILAGPTLGPTLAGLIVDTLSWHWIFWFTIPFLLISLIIGVKFIPNVNEIRQVSFDILSIVLSTIGFGGVVYGMSVGGDEGWTSPIVLMTVIVGLLSLIVFCFRQMKMEHPMLNMKAFKHPLFVLGLIMNVITFFNMLSMLVLLPMYMQVALLLTAFASGLVLLPGSLLNCLFAPMIGKLFDRYGPRSIITPGTILVALSYLLYMQYGTGTAQWLIIATHIVMMLGVGMVLASVQTNTLNALPKALFPDGIAITQTSQQVAGAIGIAIMVSVFASKQQSALAQAAQDVPAAAATGFSFAFSISLVLAVINVLLSLFLKKT